MSTSGNRFQTKTLLGGSFGYIKTNYGRKLATRTNTRFLFYITCISHRRTWVTYIILVVLTVSFGVTSYSSAWDQISYRALKILTVILESIPLILKKLMIYYHEVRFGIECQKLACHQSIQFLLHGYMSRCQLNTENVFS